MKSSVMMKQTLIASFLLFGSLIAKAPCLPAQGIDMIDHVSVSVSNLEESMEFYDAVLAKVGLIRLMFFEEYQVAGYGKDRPFFWISTQGNPDEEIGKARGMHIAFRAENPEQVKAWYNEAMQRGAKDNGLPGKRQYHPGYYGAFVIDPDGWRIEAVCHNAFEINP